MSLVGAWSDSTTNSQMVQLKSTYVVTNVVGELEYRGLYRCTILMPHKRFNFKKKKKRKREIS